VVKINLSKSLKYLMFFGLGIVIFYFVYRGQDPSRIWEGVKEFSFGWVLLSLVFSFISLLVRALRWRMMIQPLGYSPSILNTFLAILIMYLANFAFPRLGEISRCGVLTKYEKVPFTPQIGTVVTERIIDFIILIFIFLVVILAQFGLITGFIDNNRLKLGFDSPLLHSSLFWFGLLAFIILMGAVFYLYRDRIRSHAWTKKISELLKKFLEGLLSVRKLKKPGLFIFYSLSIYACYFLMTLSILRGYEPTREMGAGAAFALLAMGSIGMILPVQGGIGTYHFFVIETLLILGLARPEGQLVALVLHGSMTIFIIFIGLVALLALPIVNRKKME